MTYQIEFSRKAAKQLKSLPQDIQLRLKPRIDALANEPRPDGVAKLRGEENAYRLRVGEYRVIYEIYDKNLLILVVKVKHRSQAYGQV